MVVNQFYTCLCNFFFQETLVQNTLWPEVRKLYGHGNELYCLASNGRLVASACRASKAEQAEVILWDATNWSILQKLTGHNLTVTQACGHLLILTHSDRNVFWFAKIPHRNQVN